MRSWLLPNVDMEATVPLRESLVVRGGSGGDFVASFALVARLSQPKGVVRLIAVGGSFGGGCGDGERTLAGAALAAPPHGTEGREAEKLGNLEGRGGGFIDCSFSCWWIDCERGLTDWLSMCSIAAEDLRLFSEETDTCDCVLDRGTGAAFAT